MEKASYIAIDLKSFYASVECMERGLDPLTTNLVVADESRTEKILFAWSCPLKCPKLSYIIAREQLGGNEKLMQPAGG